MTISLMIQFDVKPDEYAGFVDMLQGVKCDLPGSGGCQSIRIFARDGVENGITLLETWRSRTEHEAHFAEINANGAWASICALLRHEPVSSYLEEL